MFIEDILYKKILQTSIIPTVDIIFLNKDKKILLWLRKNAPLQWIYYIPWWRREKNEIIVQSAARKSKQELGIDIDTTKLIFLWVYDDIFDDSAFDKISTHCCPVTYVYKLTEKEEKDIVIDTQHQSFRFFSKDDLSLHPMVLMRIKDMEKNYLFTIEK